MKDGSPFSALLFFTRVIKTDKRVKSCRHVDHHRIQNSQGSHTFHDNNSPGDDDRVMTSFDIYANFLAGFIDSRLGTVNRGSWLNMCPNAYGASVTDAAQDTACMIGGFFHLTI